MNKEIQFVDGTLTFKHLPRTTLFAIYRILNDAVWSNNAEYYSEPDNYYVDTIDEDLKD